MSVPTRNWTPAHGDPYQPVPYRPARMGPAQSLERAAELRRRMDERRTVRQFSTDPVPEQVVRDAIACAATAPSGAHQQPWTFVLVKDPEVWRRIKEAEEERRSYEGRLGEEWLAALRPLGTDEVKPHLTDAPHLVIVFQQRYWLGEDGTKRKHYYVDESVGIAVGMLLSALHLSGLAALIHTPSPCGSCPRCWGGQRTGRRSPSSWSVTRRTTARCPTWCTSRCPRCWSRSRPATFGARPLTSGHPSGGPV